MYLLKYILYNKYIKSSKGLNMNNLTCERTNQSLSISCLHNVLCNRHELPKNFPRGRYFMVDTEDVLSDIIKGVQMDELSDKLRSDLYALNTYVISKVGRLARST